MRQAFEQEVRHELSAQEVRQERKAAVRQELPGQEKVWHELPGQNVWPELREQEARRTHARTHGTRHAQVRSGTLVTSNIQK